MNEEDRSRFEEFRQFRKEVRGSSEYLLVGIDVAKEKHYAFFGTARGKTLFRRLVFENNIEGFRKLLGQAGAMKVQNVKGDALKKVSISWDKRITILLGNGLSPLYSVAYPRRTHS